MQRVLENLSVLAVTSLMGASPEGDGGGVANAAWLGANQGFKACVCTANLAEARTGADENEDAAGVRARSELRQRSVEERRVGSCFARGNTCPRCAQRRSGESVRA